LADCFAIAVNSFHDESLCCSRSLQREIGREDRELVANASRHKREDRNDQTAEAQRYGEDMTNVE
jgi:hypothetical protein